jgi:hypothetical protein
MQPLFSFRWRSSGSTVGQREAGWRRRLVRLAPVQEEEEDGWLGREGSWAGREAKAQWGEGGSQLKKKEKENGPRLGRKTDGLEVKKYSFSNKNLIFEYTEALKICRRFRRNFDMRIFPILF